MAFSFPQRVALGANRVVDKRQKVSWRSGCLFWICTNSVVGRIKLDKNSIQTLSGVANQMATFSRSCAFERRVESDAAVFAG